MFGFGLDLCLLDLVVVVVVSEGWMGKEEEEEEEEVVGSMGSSSSTVFNLFCGIAAGSGGSGDEAVVSIPLFLDVNVFRVCFLFTAGTRVEEEEEEEEGLLRNFSRSSPLPVFIPFLATAATVLTTDDGTPCFLAFSAACFTACVACCAPYLVASLANDIPASLTAGKAFLATVLMVLPATLAALRIAVLATTLLATLLATFPNIRAKILPSPLPL